MPQPVARGVRSARSGALHDWVVTVDHKRLGLMYIASGLVFFVVAGLEATLMRLQLAVPNNHVRARRRSSTACSPCTARRWSSSSACRSCFGFGELPRAADDRRARHGLPAAQRLRLLAVPLRRAAALLQLLGGDGLYGAGSAPDVGWFAYAPLTERAFSRGNSTDYWILGILVERHRQHRHRHQPDRHHRLPCAARA